MNYQIFIDSQTDKTWLIIKTKHTYLEAEYICKRCDALNKKWRIPTIEEISNSSINLEVNLTFWSKTKDIEHNNKRFIFDMDMQSTLSVDEDSLYYLTLIMDEIETKKQNYRFVIDKDSNIVDLETDIIWTRSIGKFTWEEVVDYLVEVNKDSYKRGYFYKLPSFEEIANIISLNKNKRYWSNTIVKEYMNNDVRYMIDMSKSINHKTFCTNKDVSAYIRLIKQPIKSVKFVSSFQEEEDERFKVKPSMLFSDHECCIDLNYYKEGNLQSCRILTINNFGQIELHQIFQEELKTILDLDQRERMKILLK